MNCIVMCPSSGGKFIANLIDIDGCRYWHIDAVIDYNSHIPENIKFLKHKPSIGCYFHNYLHIYKERPAHSIWENDLLEFNLEDLYTTSIFLSDYLSQFQL